MSQKSSIQRTIEILKSLNDGHTLCVSQLASAYEVSDRTIRRDFELLKEVFGDFVSKEGECYQAYSKVLLENVLSATDLMTLANIVNLFGITDKESMISDKTKCLIEKSMSVYDFKSRPFENVQNKEVIKKLEHAIKFNKEIKISYKTERPIIKTRFNPYKILFLNENFYLVGENASNPQFEFRRISMIVEVIFTQKTFNSHPEIQHFIKNLQTPWASYGSENIKVRIRVAKKVRRFFLLKKYLPSQTITHTFEDGDIEVQYAVSNVWELEDLLIKWLPHIKIIAPQNLKKMLRRTLKQKMNALSRV